ncbi:ATP-binding protein [Streptomyces sp. CC210A]|uniref:ATP-binding protein n=1 Tax=Streptomyces sp. CC210A TaxID=2898184 RepID=UPI001F3D54A9|nr:ATP-binding protein [Streptomyces sp. CC210A]
MSTSRTSGAALHTPRPQRGRRAHAALAESRRRHAPRAGAHREHATGRKAARTIRARIISLLMVPVVSLLALWGFATVTTAQDVAALRAAHLADERVGVPVAAAVTALQAERRAVQRQMAAPGPTGADALGRSVRDTDTALARLRLDGRYTTADAGGVPPETADRVRRFVEATAGLPALRAQATAAGSLSGNHTQKRSPLSLERLHDTYTAAVTAGLAVHGSLTALPGTGNGAHARVALDLAHARELLAREDAVLSTAHLTGSLPADRLREFTGAATARRTLLGSVAADLPEPARASWHRLASGDAHRRLLAAEDAVTAAAAGRRAAAAVPAATWEPVATSLSAALDALQAEVRRSATGQGRSAASAALTPAGAAVLLGLGAVAASLVISVRIGRRLVVDLVGLRDSALGIAHRELPDAMRRLRAGEALDVDGAAPQDPPAQDEIGQVRQALATVHHAALGAAAERAELAGGISRVFVNLARRSQLLVHRQLALLDSMERRADDPAALGDLFRLDHLTTRMRRHAENLIILSGAAPGRAWRTPVPLTDVVRAAVSEIEDYARVEVRPLPEAAVSGGAVADLTHLLAELVENATQFSPPHTRVRVSGEPVGNGYALEIEDRGLGMGGEALAGANRRIAGCEDLDLFDSDRLGLFVVSRLSARHAIRVHLRPSPYGGVTAVVLLPTGLLQRRGPAAPGIPGTRAPHSSADAHRPVPASAPRPAGIPAAPATVPRPTPAVRHSTLASDTGAHERGPEPARKAGTPAEPREAARAADQIPPPPARKADGSPVGHRTPTATPGGLPRRIRQASLAPQLRQEAPAPTDPSAPDTGGTTVERTPEQVRARMTAYRDGWTRGAGAVPGPLAGHPGATPPPVSRPRTLTARGSEGDAR